MIKDAIEFLMSKGNDVKKISDAYGNEVIVTNGKLNRTYEPTVQGTLDLISLEGIVDYVKNDVDRLGTTPTIHIKSENEVILYNQINDDLVRDELVRARAIVPKLYFGSFCDHEQFIINLLANFIPGEAEGKLIELLSNIKIDEGIGHTDDGISQTITAKKGVSLAENVVINPRVKLTPIRTFIEIEQPTSEFIFRVKEQKGSVGAALFEADGSLWRIAAMKSIKSYLEKHLEGENINIMM